MVLPQDCQSLACWALKRPLAAHYGDAMIRIGKLETVLAAAAGEAAGVRNRLQYLAVNDFPPGLRVGRARRADYELDELWALSLAFASMRAGMAPAASTAIISDYWPEISRALVTVGNRVLGAWRRPTPAGRAFLAITAHRLPEAIQGEPKRARARRYTVSIGPMSADALVDLIGTGGAVIIDLDRAFMEIGNGLLEGPSPIGEEEVRTALNEIEALQGASPGMASSTAPQSTEHRMHEPPPRGERLREMDFYFARAAEIATAEDLPRRPDARQAAFLRYLADPAGREEWKRWIEVAGEVPLGIAVEILSRDAFGVAAEMPETMVAAARSRLQRAGLGGAAALAAAIAEKVAAGRCFEQRL